MYNNNNRLAPNLNTQHPICDNDYALGALCGFIQIPVMHNLQRAQPPPFYHGSITHYGPPFISSAAFKSRFGKSQKTNPGFRCGKKGKGKKRLFNKCNYFKRN